MDVVHPLVDGMIENWDAMEQIWRHALVDRLNVDPAEHPLLLSEPPFNTTSKREKMTQILFETFNVPALFVSKEPVLSCFANARSTGLVVDCGGALTVCTPVFDGYIISRGVVRSPIAGDRVTDELLRRAEAKTGKTVRPGYAVKKTVDVDGTITPVYLDFPNTTESYQRWSTRQIADDLKHSVCRVYDSFFDAEANANIPCVPYELPDGQILDIGPERFVAADVLFNPALSSLPLPADAQLGLQQLVHNSIAQCDVESRREYYSNIIVTGGTSLLTGFTDRLTKEIIESGPAQKIKLIATNYAAERKFSVWLGGSILASLGTFQQMWVSQAEYKEYGAPIVNRKCP